MKNVIQRVNEIERDFLLFESASGRFEPILAVKTLNCTPRPNVPSQKAWLEIASGNHSRIFTTLLPDCFFYSF